MSPIGPTGPISVSDILTVKGFRRTPTPSFNFFLQDVVTNRQPAEPVSFQYLFTQNRKTGPDPNPPHALSEWRGVGNEVNSLPSAVVVEAVGVGAVQVRWANGEPVSTVIVLYRRVGFVVDPDPGDPGLYTLAGTWVTTPGATSYTFPGLEPGRYKAAVSHFHANTEGGDNNTGFQTLFVMSGNNTLVTTSGVVPSESPGDEHPFAISIEGRFFDGDAGLHRGFSFANRCTEASTTSLLAYMDTAEFGVGTVLYQNANGADLAPMSTGGPGSGPYYRVAAAGGGVLAFAIDGNRTVTDFGTC